MPLFHMSFRVYKRTIYSRVKTLESYVEIRSNIKINILSVFIHFVKCFDNLDVKNNFMHINFS